MGGFRFWPQQSTLITMAAICSIVQQALSGADQRTTSAKQTSKTLDLALDSTMDSALNWAASAAGWTRLSYQPSNGQVYSSCNRLGTLAGVGADVVVGTAIAAACAALSWSCRRASSFRAIEIDILAKLSRAVCC